MQHVPGCFMQAEVQNALGNTYSAAAGKKMERWVHSRVTHLTQRLDQVCPKVRLRVNIWLALCEPQAMAAAESFSEANH